jgi:integrase
VDDEGRRHPVYFATEKEALAAKALIDRKIESLTSTTISEALQAYELFLRDKGNLTQSITDTMRELNRFFTDQDITIRSLTKEDGIRLYKELAASTKVVRKEKRDAAGNVIQEEVREPIKPDTHRHMLLQARSFLRWCVAKEWTPINALEGVQGIGKKRKGKKQLRIDEIRKWEETALKLAYARDEGALAALMTLYLAPRASEITKRRVRDVDDEARLLIIEDAKTEAGTRSVEFPAILRPLILAHIDGRAKGEYLFQTQTKEKGPHWRDWPRENIQRICRLAGVPLTTAHGMRGLHSTLAIEDGTSSHAVERQMGHEDFDKTTAQHYVAPGTVQKQQARRLWKVIEGGASGPPQRPESL